jgi:tRNA(Ile)-lysidine synthase
MSNLNIPLIIHKVKVPKTGNLENHARKLRFSVFAKVLDSYKFDKILLAHQREDQAETVLLNLFRGSGITGMAGIKAISGKIVHPMLCFSRKELEDILSKVDITWRTDSSNLDNKFRRNLLRNELIPRLEREFNPMLSSHLSFVAELFAQADKILKQRSESQYKRICLDIQPERTVLSCPLLIKLSKLKGIIYFAMSLSGLDDDNDFFAVSLSGDR